MAGPELTLSVTGNPFVEVYFDPADLDADTVRLRIYRLSEGRTWKVRGGWDVAVGVPAIDWECPFQTSAAYRAEMFDVSGASIGFTDTTTINLDIDDVWVHNPLSPELAVNLGPIGLKAEQRSTGRPLRGESVETEGAAGVRRIGSGRSGVRGYRMGFAVTSTADMDTIQAMLGTYETPQVGVLCIRTPPPVRIPRTFFTTVDDDDERSIDTNWGGGRSDFTFIANEADPPFVGLVTALLSYEDMEAAYSTYEEAEAAYATYEEATRDYSLAGLSG